MGSMRIHNWYMLSVKSNPYSTSLIRVVENLKDSFYYHSIYNIELNKTMTMFLIWLNKNDVTLIRWLIMV